MRAENDTVAKSKGQTLLDRLKEAQQVSSLLSSATSCLQHLVSAVHMAEDTLSSLGPSPEFKSGTSRLRGWAAQAHGKISATLQHELALAIQRLRGVARTQLEALPGA